MGNVFKPILLSILVSTSVYAADAPLQCGKDTDCKGDRICESGQCVSPTLGSSPAAPAVEYEALVISGDEAGPFFLDDGPGYNQLAYLSRAGVTNLMDSVTEYPDSIGYLKFEKVFAFGPHRYVVIVSTGENGNACPATTYAISYDTRTESIQGHASIDGCSEEVQAFAEGNKLSIKKEGRTTVIHNAEIK